LQNNQERKITLQLQEQGNTVITTQGNKKGPQATKKRKGRIDTCRKNAKPKKRHREK